jgi:hypothetical protein
MAAATKKQADGAAPSGVAADSTLTEKHEGLVGVVITTAHRGVFHGWCDPMDVDSGSKTIRVRECRMVVYWSAEAKGVLGLGVDGPARGSKVGPAVPKATLNDVTGVFTCTAAANAAWASEPWSR